jgi:four helix bundle protein
MRNYKNLKAFELSDALVIQIYRVTSEFPKEEQFSLTSQLRRAAVSIASNIVEGCARHSQTDYLRFLDMAYGSACEVEYQLSIAYRLGYIQKASYQTLQKQSVEVSKVINGLIRSLRNPEV